MNRVTVSQTAQRARTHPSRCLFLHDPYNFVGLANTRGNCVSQGQVAIVGGLWAGLVAEGEGLCHAGSRHCNCGCQFGSYQVGCSCFPGREETSVQAALEDTVWTEAVSRRFGTEKKVKLVQGSKEVAELQSICELEWFRICGGEDAASEGMDAFSILYCSEYNSQQIGAFPPVEARKPHTPWCVHPWGTGALGERFHKQVLQPNSALFATAS